MIDANKANSFICCYDISVVVLPYCVAQPNNS